MHFLAHVTRGLAAACFLCAPLLSSASARADAADRDVVVVTVTPPGSLDAYRLRGAVGVELGVDAVAPDDPRAPDARGAFTVGVDRDGRHLKVSYLARSEPVTRTVDLPADAEAIQREAVVLAGNLGRDEASELAASLRHATREAPAPAPASARASPGDAAESDAERNGRDLQAALDYYAEQDRHTRAAFSWTAAGVGLLAAGVIVGTPFMERGGVSSASDFEDALAIAALPGASMIGVALMTALSQTQLERLADYDRQNGAEATAQTWAQWAARERSARRLSGVALLISGGLEAAVGALVAFDSAAHVEPSSRTLEASSLFAIGSVFALWGVTELASDGPVETALHAYERGHGIPLWGLAEHVAVGPTAGGATAGFHGTF